MGTRVDIIITTFNRPQLVRRAVRSVLGQTHRDLRLIVVDDASATDTVGALGDDFHRLEYVRHEGNRGGPAARNTGLDYATADYVGFLDDDDEFLPIKLEEQLRVLESAPESAIGVDCGSICVTDEGAVQVGASLGPSGGRDLLLHRSAGGMGSTILYRRQRIGDLRFDEALPAYQEYDFLLRAMERGPIVAFDDPLIRWHLHDGARITNPRAHRDAIVYLLKKYAALIESDPKAVLVWHRKLGRVHLALDDSRAASEEFRLAAASSAAPRWFRVVARTPPTALPTTWKAVTSLAAFRAT